MWKVNEKKASVWSRLDKDSDIDVFIYGDHVNPTDDNEETESD